MCNIHIIEYMKLYAFENDAVIIINNIPVLKNLELKLLKFMCGCLVDFEMNQTAKILISNSGFAITNYINPQLFSVTSQQQQQKNS